MPPLILAFSDTSLLLLLLIILLTLFLKYFSRYTPLVHPLYLNQQSELVTKTRKRGETGRYRRWGTGASEVSARS